MLIATLTFVACAAIILGAYWLFIVRPEAAAARELRTRLAPQVPERAQRLDLARDPAHITILGALDLALTRAGGLSRSVAETVRLSNLRVTVSGILLGGAGAGVLVALAVALATGSIPAAAVAGLLSASLPYAYVRRAARLRVNRLEEQFPQAIELIAVSLRAGHALTTGLLMVAEEIADPIGGEFRRIYEQQNYGRSLPAVLKEFVDRVPLLDARIFVTAVLTQRETGGNLAEVLDKLARLIRERFTIRRQVRVVSAHGRITGWVLAGLPPVVAGVLFTISPDHMMTLVTDPIGRQLIAAAVLLQIAGTLAVRRIVHIEV
jgi:tight adherence protein B